MLCRSCTSVVLFFFPPPPEIAFSRISSAACLPPQWSSPYGKGVLGLLLFSGPLRRSGLWWRGRRGRSLFDPPFLPRSCSEEGDRNVFSFVDAVFVYAHPVSSQGPLPPFVSYVFLPGPPPALTGLCPFEPDGSSFGGTFVLVLRGACFPPVWEVSKTAQRLFQHLVIDVSRHCFFLSPLLSLPPSLFFFDPSFLCRRRRGVTFIWCRTFFLGMAF